MTGIPVPISSVEIDPPFVRRVSHVRYRVTLRCGCQWWEDHAVGDPAPIIGTIVRCFAAHSLPRVDLQNMMRRERSVAADAPARVTVRVRSPNQLARLRR